MYTQSLLHRYDYPALLIIGGGIIRVNRITFVNRANGHSLSVNAFARQAASDGFGAGHPHFGIFCLGSAVANVAHNRDS